MPRLRRSDCSDPGLSARDLGRESLDHERVLACAVRLLDRGLFRIGSDSYASENGSYGLTTILKRHVQAGDGTLRFDYPARERAIRAVTREVAEHLGNTPAVARRAYIDPRVLDRFRSGWQLELASSDVGAGDVGAGRARRRLERAVLELLG